MKKLFLPLFLASALAASAQSLVTGLDVGYLTDAEETYYAGRLGYVFRANETFTHQVEAEIGYTSSGTAGASANLMPVTVNYRLGSVTSGNFGYHVGAGAGIARLRAAGVSTGGPVTLSDTTFAAQGFTGITYQATPSVALNLGAKYIWIDDVRLAGTNVEIGDDLVVSAGLSIRF